MLTPRPSYWLSCGVLHPRLAACSTGWPSALRALQAQVVRDPAVDVAPETVLIVPGRTVAVVAVLGLTAQRQVISEVLAAAPQRDVPFGLERHGLDDRAEPVGVRVAPGIGTRTGLLDLICRVRRWQVPVQVDL